MFGIIYAMLFAVWIHLLNDKIQKGPEPESFPGETSVESVLDVASRYPGHRDSITDAKQ
jgi:cytochrome bd ubiquinol oxidase subunit I